MTSNHQSITARRYPPMDSKPSPMPQRSSPPAASTMEELFPGTDDHRVSARAPSSTSASTMDDLVSRTPPSSATSPKKPVISPEPQQQQNGRIPMGRPPRPYEPSMLTLFLDALRIPKDYVCDDIMNVIQFYEALHLVPGPFPPTSRAGMATLRDNVGKLHAAIGIPRGYPPEESIAIMQAYEDLRDLLGLATPPYDWPHNVLHKEMRALARRYHPDMINQRGDKPDTEKFKKLLAAWSVVDKFKREPRDFLTRRPERLAIPMNPNS